MRRWLAFAIGLLAATAAALALFSMGRGLPDPEPHDDIDAASRRALERVLRESRSE